MPPLATSNLPMRALRSAPVKAPGAVPNSSASTRLSGIAATLTATKGLRARGEVMDALGQQLLAGAGLATQQHRGIELRGAGPGA